MKKVLVTGATGNVGSRVVRELRACGVPVRALVRDWDGVAGKLGDGVELVSGDFSDAASVCRALEGVEGVFLACANDPRQVEYETGVIDAAAAAGVRRIVKLSATGAQIGSPLAFWDWHGRIEQHLRASGLRAIILRPSFYMSNLLGSTEAIKHSGKLFAPAVGARIAMINPLDVGAAAAVALIEDGHEGRAYTLTGPKAITYDEIAGHLSMVIGQKIEFVGVSDEAARRSFLESGMPDWLAEQLVAMFGILRQGAAAQISDQVRALTGREPRSFAKFARDHAGLFRS